MEDKQTQQNNVLSFYQPPAFFCEKGRKIY